MDEILSTEGLTKTYKSKKAVDNVSIKINKGDIFGFVGLNGSGKTTFIRLVTGLITPSAGKFSLFGKSGAKNNSDALKRISSMVETPSIYMNLSASENIEIQRNIANIKDKSVTKDLLDLVGLDPKSSKVAKSFSLGMRQRLGIAMALVGNPEFMLLDEPTNGLDPEGIVEIRELLLKLNREKGMTILVSSHILSELSKLASTYGFIHQGKIIKQATNREIEESCVGKIILMPDNMQLAAQALEGKTRFNVNKSTIDIYADITITELVNLMTYHKVNVISANKVTEDLESYFINLIREEGGKKHVSI